MNEPLRLFGEKTAVEPVGRTSLNNVPQPQDVIGIAMPGIDCATICKVAEGRQVEFDDGDHVIKLLRELWPEFSCEKRSEEIWCGSIMRRSYRLDVDITTSGLALECDSELPGDLKVELEELCVRNGWTLIYSSSDEDRVIRRDADG